METLERTMEMGRIIDIKKIKNQHLNTTKILIYVSTARKMKARKSIA